MSINKYQFSLQHPSIQQCCQNLQKGALNLTEIQCENRHGDHMDSGFPQFCGDQPHAAFALRQTELALHFHTLALVPIILSLVSDFALLWAPQCRTGEPDTMLLAITEILPVPVDLVR